MGKVLGTKCNSNINKSPLSHLNSLIDLSNILHMCNKLGPKIKLLFLKLHESACKNFSFLCVELHKKMLRLAR